MSDPEVSIRLDGDREPYRPGEVLSGRYRLDAQPDREIEAVELSVLWFTEGKGDEDLGVHHFESKSAAEGDRIVPSELWIFSTNLPHSPLSYDGRIVKIRWCVRVRVLLSGRDEWVGEVPFHLGNVTRPKEPLE